MRKHRTLVGGAIFAAAVAVLLLVWPWGPSYQGKSIEKWFGAGGDFRSPTELELDRQAFRAMGRKAVPFLVARLDEAPSGRIKGLLSKFWPTRSEIYRQRKQMWQCRAAYLLGEIGPAARSAEPNLAKWATGGFWAVRGEATVALMKIRGQPPEALIEKLKDTSDWQAWYENAMMVGSFGYSAESAVPILLRALQDSNNIVQAHALIALGMIGRQSDRCVPAILPFLKSPNVSDRQKAMWALFMFGTNALPAEAAIHAALSDSDPWVRHEADFAVRKLPAASKADDRVQSAEQVEAPNEQR